MRYMIFFYNNIFKVLFIIFILISTANASITTVSDFREIKNYMGRLDRSSLVIFDVDCVLIIPSDNDTLSRSPYRKKLWRSVESRISKERSRFLISIIIMETNWILLDKSVIDIINYLTQQKIPTIALTSINTGRFGVIESMEDLRIKQLKSVGIDFTKLAPMKDTIKLDSLRTVHGTPMLNKGIIFTAELDKGMVLKDILQKLNYYPKKIIFIDDKIQNLYSVQNACNMLKIPFQGFHYTAIKYLPIPNINQKLERLRFKILENEHRWVQYCTIENNY